MERLLAVIELVTKDFASQEEGKAIYSGEVIEQDDGYKKYLYRFYNEDTGLINVQIDFSKDVIKITEKNDVVYMSLRFKHGEIEECTYQFVESNSLLKFKTLLRDFQISKDYVEFIYDLFDPNDLSKPITRNIFSITVKEERTNVC